MATDLADMRVEAEGEKLRTALLNSLSHDLRTPLVSVIGALSGLADDSVPVGSRAELAQTGLDEARRLDRYVQNLLNMTRLEYGALRPRKVPSDVRELVGVVRTDLAGVLGHHQLELDLSPDLPKLDIDPVLIGQAVGNVLENAAKYAPSGSTIRVTAAPVQSRVILRVTDEGPGIPAAERDKVFDLFYRVAEGDRRPTGTGLGLAIVRGFVEANGGRVQALEGPRGRGTTIEIELPAANEEANA
jgi:two-component system sensor histidine kinase KdpD